MVKRLMWNLGSVGLEIVLILMQDRCTVLHGTYHMLRNPFGRTPIELLDDMCHMESRFGLFGDRFSFGAR